MKAYSGILKIKKNSRVEGRVVIDFSDFPGEGSSVGDATLYQGRQVGGRGKFNANPAYFVQIREWVANDHTDTEGLPNIPIAKIFVGYEYERDSWEMNSTATKDSLKAAWKVMHFQRSQGEGEIREISFLVMGN